ncbi:MAG: FAD-dependent monooxygenase, partial [Hyphomicrobiales bacterium]|nr:FAD-dependent monooxygenase [Hyphomicrobiales bacterium]
GAARAAPRLARREAKIAHVAFGDDAATLAPHDGEALSARLVVAADGRDSPTRASAGIATRRAPWPQSAVTAILSHDRPHCGLSTEFHRRAGPFTFVPMRDGADGRPRSSLVWVTSPAEAARLARLDDSGFADEVGRGARRLWGAMRVVGPRGLFPLETMRATSMVAPRLALVGDAAHAFPPIGAQGLNLGLRDAFAVAEAAAAHGDPGGEAAMVDYSRARSSDVATRTLGVGLLNEAPLAGGPFDAVRALGIGALVAIGPLRRRAMRLGAGMAAR